MCWQTATNPQCFRVETATETHLFPYGYFQSAKLSREGNKDTIEIHFQNTVVKARGKGSESLFDALARLSVERIKVCPAKYGAALTDGFISDIELKQIAKNNED